MNKAKDILIYVPKKYRDEENCDDEHFFWNKVSVGELDRDWEFEWSLSVTPKQNIGMVHFTDGVNIIAEGNVIEVQKGYIIFKSLNRVCYPQPKKAPTRGFTYL